MWCCTTSRSPAATPTWTTWPSARAGCRHRLQVLPERPPARWRRDALVWPLPLAQQLATAVWATLRVAEALQLPPEVPVVPLLVIHRAPVPWGGLTVAGVQVIPPSALGEVLGREAVLPAAQVELIAGQATARLHPAG
jgi:hypothetical protein